MDKQVCLSNKGTLALFSQQEQNQFQRWKVEEGKSWIQSESWKKASVRDAPAIYANKSQKKLYSNQATILYSLSWEQVQMNKRLTSE